MLTVPPPATVLDESSVRSAPTQTGVYAAWITDPESLAQCGVAGPEPRVVYIGKASGRGGLRSRLLRHTRVPFFSLLDLLASRGTVVPCWWHVAWKEQPHKRVLKTPPLAKIAEDAALAWQHAHLRWGWVLSENPALLESALIADYQPLLNLRGRGFVRLRPPQLRSIGVFERERAAWLFSTAWIAVLTAAEDEWNTWDESSRAIGVEIDEAGWPMPLGRGGRQVELTLPTELDAQRIVQEAHEVDFNEYDDEGLAWWAAYAGLAFRPRAQAVDEALRLAFRRDVNALNMPLELPPPGRLEGLVRVIRMLPGVAH